MATKFKVDDRVFMVYLNALRSEVIAAKITYVWEGHGYNGPQTEYGVTYDDPSDDDCYHKCHESNVKENRLYANKSDAYTELKRRLHNEMSYHQSMYNEYLAMCERINKWRDEAIAEEAT